MRPFFVLALTLGIGITRGEPIPACASFGTLGELVGRTTCGVGIFTIKDVTFTGPAGLADLLSLNIGSTVDNVNFGVGGELFSDRGGSIIFAYGYTIDPPPDIIKGVSGDVEDAGQGNFFSPFVRLAATADAVSIQYSICAGAAFTNNECAGTLYGFSLSVPDLLDASPDLLSLASTLSGGVIFSEPVNTVGILVSIRLQNGGFLNGDMTTGFPLDPDPSSGGVPEPGTSALVGLGCAAAAALSARGRGGWRTIR